MRKEKDAPVDSRTIFHGIGGLDSISFDGCIGIRPWSVHFMRLAWPTRKIITKDTTHLCKAATQAAAAKAEDPILKILAPGKRHIPECVVGIPAGGLWTWLHASSALRQLHGQADTT